MIQGIDPLCTSCKIMTIPAHARGKPRESTVSTTLDEIQVDTVTNPEPMGLSADSQFNYFLIFCDRYSRLFRICGIKDKTTGACIDGIELIISTIPGDNQQPKAIIDISVAMLVQNFDLTHSENGVVKTKYISHLQRPNIKNKTVWSNGTGGL